MDHMFENPTILEDLDILFKDDTARRMIVFYQPESEVEAEEDLDLRQRTRRVAEASTPTPGKVLNFYFAAFLELLVKNCLFTTDGSDCALTNVCIYFLRLSTKKYLGEETFQVSDKH